ncbi:MULTISPECIES: bifunctional DNA primase/helicase [Bacteroidaceae]|uniref:Bifunctional DNA primase/helicase n=1 Tax=Phocaeicola intestinalis TaxID=2762212 RepID=A0ABR8Y549_9BACT|nr:MULTISPECIES: bifunctional DNA primase/helicase [Bacteroidaceae]MBD8039337.1 bifunctional DNA primase/helicase [Phocaeicola intestinalis]MBU9950824.1 bifunctional DNA primase/helicase [Bacteroides sp. MSK.20.12]MBV3450495.1 bifunctional DNA primase/helicase [Bacteroides xylanisolvens]
MNKEDILQATDRGLSVFRHYLPVPFRIGKKFLNPLYKDTKASCNVYYDRRHSVYKMKDFGNEEYSGDCFELVGTMTGLSCRNAKDFVEIMRIIDHDLHLGLADGYENCVDTSSVQVVCPPTPEQVIKKIRPYNIVPRAFNETDRIFWSKSRITEHTLNKYNVRPLHSFSSVNQEGKSYTLTETAQEPMYGYVGDKYIKIYRPRSEMRFLYAGDLGDNYCFGLDQLSAKGDLLFITGGEKDVMSLAANGFHAICFNSETTVIPTSVLMLLSYRFKHIVLLYDMDKTGLEVSAKRQEELKPFALKRLLLPLSGTKEEKDVTDYFALGHTHDDLLKLFLNHLDSLYKEDMSALKSCELDFNNPPPVAQMIVSVNDVPLGTQGNLLCITGGEGTGKSNYVAALIAGAVKPENAEGIDTLGVSIEGNPKGKAVLFYDTEQSEVQLYKNVSTLLRRCGRDTMPEWFKAYCLTGMSRKERLKSIVLSMDKFHYQYGGIHLVVIDGIADLIRCANDEAESIAVVEELYRLAGIYNTCIVTVLHFIPNGLKLRGHLGSELQRKAAAILSIEKDTNPAVSVVKALKVRDGSPLDVPLMQFAWDKEKAMHAYLGEKPKEEKDRRKEEELVAVARELFSRKRFIGYMELSEELQAAFEVKERTAKSYIRFMREKEIIVKSPDSPNSYMLGEV